MTDAQKASKERDLEARIRQEEAERKALTDNANFTQINNTYGWKTMRMMAKENPVAHQIFLFLGEHMDNYNAVLASSKVLQEVTGKGRTTVSNAVKYLKENGIVSILKSGNSNVYILNPDLLWKNYNNRKSYCKFEGAMLISKKENEEIFDQMRSLSQRIIEKKA
ncbi:replication/maintenance protein RepL [Vibrio astriarenae]